MTEKNPRVSFDISHDEGTQDISAEVHDKTRVNPPPHGRGVD